jgi:hypothetical protein
MKRRRLHNLDTLDRRELRLKKEKVVFDAEVDGRDVEDNPGFLFQLIDVENDGLSGIQDGGE